MSARASAALVVLNIVVLGAVVLAFFTLDARARAGERDTWNVLVEVRSELNELEDRLELICEAVLRDREDLQPQCFIEMEV